MTLFLSTHQLSVAEEVADRIGIIHHGKLIALGTVQELRAQAHEEARWKKSSSRSSTTRRRTFETEGIRPKSSRSPVSCCCSAG